MAHWLPETSETDAAVDATRANTSSARCEETSPFHSRDIRIIGNSSSTFKQTESDSQCYILYYEHNKLETASQFRNTSNPSTDAPSWSRANLQLTGLLRAWTKPGP